MGPREVILGGVVPGCIAGVVLLVGWFAFWRKDAPRRPLWAAPLAFGLAYLPADWAINNFPGWWPKDATLRFQHVAVAALVVGVAMSVLRRAVVRHVLGAALLAASAWALLSGLHPHVLDTPRLAAWVGGMAIGGGALVWALDRVAERSRGWALPVQLVIVMLGAGPVFFFSHQASFARQSGALVAACAAAAIVGAVRPGLVLARGGVLVLMTVLVGLTAAAYHYSFHPVHVSASALLLLAPLGAGVPMLPVVRDWSRRAQAAVGFAAVALLTVAAVGVALATRYVSDPDPYSAY